MRFGIAHERTPRHRVAGFADARCSRAAKYDRRKSNSSTAFRTACVRHDKRPRGGGLRSGLSGGKKKAAVGKKGKKNARFAVERNELLRGRLIRDLIICCEKTGRRK